jgi:hypothetical protein
MANSDITQQLAPFMYLLSDPDFVDKAEKVSQGIVYQQVNQAMGIAVQDSVDHLQQMLALNATTNAKVVQLILTYKSKEQYMDDAIEVSNNAVTNAVSWMGDIGKEAKNVLKDFSSAP